VTDPDIHDILAEPTPEYDWKIPGVAESGDRIILTGDEGAGKTTFLRQIAVQSASGVHPFTLDPMPPLNVLHLDAENSRTFSKREYRPLVELAGSQLGAGRLIPHFRPEGINLSTWTDQRWVRERCEATRPDILIVGPLYKLHEEDPNKERPARIVAAFLDAIRTEYKFALFIEAHSPHAAPGFTRPPRPYGASLWMRWPEFGFHLSKAGLVTHWRGPRDTRDWPAQFQREGRWPWNVPTNPDTVLFGKLATFVLQAATIPSLRTLEQQLGISKSTIDRCIKANSDKWAQVLEAQRTYGGRGTDSVEP
jgi:replicative DNA helicase